MKRHFTGFVVFALVAAGSAFGVFMIDRVWSLATISDDAVRLENEVRSTGIRPESVTGQLSSVFYDEASNRFVATLNLQWNGISQPPDLVNVSIGLSTPEKPGETDVIHYLTLNKPFGHDNAISQQIEWEDLFWGKLNLSKRRAKANFYAHAAVSVPGEESEMTQLVIYEYNYLRGAVPLLIKHREK